MPVPKKLRLHSLQFLANHCYLDAFSSVDWEKLQHWDPLPISNYWGEKRSQQTTSAVMGQVVMCATPLTVMRMTVQVEVQQAWTIARLRILPDKTNAILVLIPMMSVPRVAGQVRVVMNVTAGGRRQVGQSRTIAIMGGGMPAPLLALHSRAVADTIIVRPTRREMSQTCVMPPTQIFVIGSHQISVMTLVRAEIMLVLAKMVQMIHVRGISDRQMPVMMGPPLKIYARVILAEIYVWAWLVMSKQTNAQVISLRKMNALRDAHLPKIDVIHMHQIRIRGITNE